MKVHIGLVFLIVITVLIYAGMAASVIHNCTFDVAFIIVPGMAVMSILSAAIGKCVYDD